LRASRVLFAAAFVAALLLPAAALRATAKNAPGNISGTVHDPSSAVIPGAIVTLINMETQQGIGGYTGEDGAFQFPAIPAGRYRLEITKPGFAPTKSANLELKPSSDLHQDITMDLGTLTQDIFLIGHRSGEKPSTPSHAPRRIRVGGQVESAKLIFQSKPVYPTSAQQHGIEGTVILQAVIGTSGDLLSLSPYNNADPTLVDAAMNAVRQWRYQPTLLDGVPVEVATTIKVHFQLEE
jgi:TonB family protein